MDEPKPAHSSKKPVEIPLGAVRFGDLKRLSPIGRDWGYDRGTPVARYYIDDFLSRHAADMANAGTEVEHGINAEPLNEVRPDARAKGKRSPSFIFPPRCGRSCASRTVSHCSWS